MLELLCFVMVVAYFSTLVFLRSTDLRHESFTSFYTLGLKRGWDWPEAVRIGLVLLVAAFFDNVFFSSPFLVLLAFVTVVKHPLCYPWSSRI